MTAARVSGFDPGQGPRAEIYRHYRALRQARWSLTTRVEVGPLLAALPGWREAVPGLSAFVAYHHAVIRAANAIPQLRQRLVEGGNALEWERIDGTPTVLRADDSFAVARLAFLLRLRDFAQPALDAVAAAVQPGGPLGFVAQPQGELHMTTLPLVAFTAFNHAQGDGFDDATPRVAMGRFTAEGGRLWMPLNIEVHHALVDGVHVGRFLQALEGLLAEPESLW